MISLFGWPRAALVPRMAIGRGGLSAQILLA
jgi:hypothetical protein